MGTRKFWDEVISKLFCPSKHDIIEDEIKMWSEASARDCADFMAKIEGKRPKIQIYKDKKGEYRWRLKAINGKIIADSGEGYKRKRNARIAIDRVVVAFNRCVIEEK